MAQRAEVPGETAPTVARCLTVDATLASKLNLADLQNAVPLIRELAITSTLEIESGPLELSIQSVPAFFKPKTWRLDSVRPDQRYRIKDLDLALDGPLLTMLTESEVANLTFALRRAGDDTPVAEISRQVELLPRNQWGGLSHVPDMVAAFVQPNDPAIDKILKKAAELLRGHGRSASLDGYTKGSKRAWELTAAIWGAVVSMKIDYALPPASFEQTGQKIRSATQITDAGLATCMDLALVFCSCLEQAGLNPIVVFTKGHAFPGVWLRAEEFSSTVVDDITALRKRLKLKELVLFESTLAAKHPSVNFLRAVDLGAEMVAEGCDETFELAVDIRRARLQRIKPLASQTMVVVARDAPDIETADEVGLDEAPDLPEDDAPGEDEAAIDPQDRLARWQRKLLDLSLRNNLLNFKSHKRSLRLDAPDPSALEDLMSDGKEIKLLPRPELMDGRDPRDLAIHEGRDQENLRRQFAIDALKRREVFIELPATELESRLVELYRTARTNSQEGGSNTLFMALGFLNWTRTDKEAVKYRAPLVLVPVTLTRRSVRSNFTLSLHDDEPRFNPTLIEMLRQDFQLHLGIADGEMPRDDAGLDIERVWKTVSAAIKDVKGWEVSEEVVLSTFSFAKYLMWVDLVQRSDQLRQNPVVKHLIDTPRDPYLSASRFPQPHSLDKDFGPEQTFCPLPADSSQLSAVMAAVKGKDFVLIGPPGTGKSQTIANLIAQCMAEGKRVLFVSEKIAALDVVYRRLREAGLGEFCLELHSSKSRKADVLAQLKASWDAKGNVDAAAWEREAARLRRLRDELNGYVERLHHRHSNGRSIFEAIGAVVGGHDVPALAMSWPSPACHSDSDAILLSEVVDRIEVNAIAVGVDNLAHGPLADIAHADWSPAWQQNITDAARQLLPIVDAVVQSYERLRAVTKLPYSSLGQRARSAVASLAECLPQAAGKDWRFAFGASARTVTRLLLDGSSLLDEHARLSRALSAGWSAQARKAAARGLALIQQRRELQKQLPEPWPEFTVTAFWQGLGLLERLQSKLQELSVRYSDAIEQVNVYQLQRDLLKARKSIWPVSWLGGRKVRQALEALVAGQGEPMVAEDLHTWVTIRDLRAELSQLDVGNGAHDVWSGLTTRSDVLRAGLLLQDVLKTSEADITFDSTALESLRAGRGGEAMARTVGILERLSDLDAEIAGMQTLSNETHQLWKGRSTDLALFQETLAFTEDLERVRASGIPGQGFEQVAQGLAGATLAADLAALRERSAIEAKLAALQDLIEICPSVWRGLETDGAELNAAVAFQRAIASAVANLADDPAVVAEVSGTLERLVTEGNALLDASGPVAAEGRAYLEALVNLQPFIDRLCSLGAFDAQNEARYASWDLVQLRGACQGIIGAESKLNAWCAWRKVRQHAMALGLSSMVEALERRLVAPMDAQRAFETNYCRWWLNAIVDCEPVIRTFVSAEHEKRIADFRALDQRFNELTKAWLRANLCAGLPSPDEVTRGSEWGFLRHEITKKKAHKPLRELMSHIPTALTKLTPCLLMSPLSIAQYLVADATPFDLVVFDEASQIPIWDAIGAIARGKQVVMVGDPKQLPPTSFFDRAESPSDDEDVEGDLESILDECIGASLPTLNLSWHYRSRHESLIAFSNHRYYGGGLVTFPSPVTDDRAVSFHLVDGVYEKGGARINKGEAKAVVADIVRRLQSPAFRASRLTVGVVTFNSEQQKLIEDLLDEERRKDPNLEPYFAESALEPLFVKNLESVQGDERDIMYFSITYGPDAGGVVSMNFGPMNRDGGERRLNVAITRARHELRVFSTLRAERMDLSKTQSAGVRDLKHFLEFAERGPRALAEVSAGSLGGFESPFEEAVAGALAGNGWTLHTQVGASSFRVDLAVVHPDAPGAYLCGIECDGATYHRSATAKDRDMLREQVLRGLGWEILRIWSTDWWVDPQGTAAKVHAQLTALLEASRAERALEAERSAAAMEADEAILEAKSADLGRLAQVGDGGQDSMNIPADETAIDGAVEATGETPATTGPQATPAATQYEEADPVDTGVAPSSEAFFELSYEGVLLSMVRRVVEIEGPVQDMVLARRIAKAHGWQRTGSRIQERVETIARLAFKTSEEEGVGTFYWPSTMSPGQVVVFRHHTDDSPRMVNEVCIEELLSLAAMVAPTAADDEELLVTMCRELGIRRLGAAVRARLETALALHRARNDAAV